MRPLQRERRERREPRDYYANSPKLFFYYSFVNLTHFMVIDINYFTRIFTLPSIIVGFDVKLQPLSSIIVGIFYEFQPSSICPRTAKATPKGGQREPKGTPRLPKGHPKGAHGLPNESKGAQSRSRGRQRRSKDTQRQPKEAKGKRYISKNSRSTAQADVMLQHGSWEQQCIHGHHFGDTGSFVWLYMAIYGYIRSKICILDVWTCI